MICIFFSIKYCHMNIINQGNKQGAKKHDKLFYSLLLFFFFFYATFRSMNNENAIDMWFYFMFLSFVHISGSNICLIHNDIFGFLI